MNILLNCKCPFHSEVLHCWAKGKVSSYIVKGSLSQRPFCLHGDENEMFAVGVGDLLPVGEVDVSPSTHYGNARLWAGHP